MMKLVALAGFAFAVATSVQAMPRATVGQADSLIAQVREGCGIGMVVVDGQCVSRHDLRVNRRVERRLDRRGYYGAPGGAVVGPYAYVDTPGAIAIGRYRSSWENDWQGYASRNGIVCVPGNNVSMGGRDYLCQ